MVPPTPTESPASVREEALGNIFGKCGVFDQVLPDRNRISEDIEEQNGSDRIVKTRNLSGIFDIGHSFVLPAVGNLFKDVVDLFARDIVKSQP
jgi:hypothetical protein